MLTARMFPTVPNLITLRIHGTASSAINSIPINSTTFRIPSIGVFRFVVRSSQEFGEGTDKQESKVWHACTDDADVDFNCRP